jgi:hypothetical protein
MHQSAPNRTKPHRILKLIAFDLVANIRPQNQVELASHLGDKKSESRLFAFHSATRSFD